jgi:hypothetical protein
MWRPGYRSWSSSGVRSSRDARARGLRLGAVRLSGQRDRRRGGDIRRVLAGDRELLARAAGFAGRCSVRQRTDVKAMVRAARVARSRGPLVAQRTELVYSCWRALTWSPRCPRPPSLWVVLRAHGDGWPATTIDEDVAGRCADVRTRPGTRGTRRCRCRRITFCDSRCDVQRPGRAQISSTGTDANRWSQ